MTYLQLTETTEYLAKLGDCPPPGECLADWIATTESLMDEWLGKRLGIIKYVETYSPNHRGLIILRQAPIVDLLQVCVRDTIIYHKDKQYPLSTYTAQVIWDGRFNIQTSECECSTTIYEVTYTAGKEVPPIAKAVARAILKEIVTSDGDITSLFESPREIEEVQNPSVGGTFKQRFKRTAGVAGETLIDRLMKPLSRYKVKYRM